MGRAPCCEKMGLKKGPWTPEEDQILVSYIRRFGHGNWRALPKQAGLLRCGKSCRLRWTNYLRPDIKRGNLTREEEEAIIKLHELLGNRWSAIAARLPGRTDNEIKNVWHTHLKKRIKLNQPTQDYNTINCSMITSADPDCEFLEARLRGTSSNITNNNNIAPQQYSPTTTTEFSFSGTDSSTETTENHTTAAAKGDDPNADIDENLWSEVLSADQEGREINQLAEQYGYTYGPCNDDSLDFWLNLYVHAGELTELPEF